MFFGIRSEDSLYKELFPDRAHIGRLGDDRIFVTHRRQRLADVGRAMSHLEGDRFEQIANSLFPDIAVLKEEEAALAVFLLEMVDHRSGEKRLAAS